MKPLLMTGRKTMGNVIVHGPRQGCAGWYGPELWFSQAMLDDPPRGWSVAERIATVDDDGTKKVYVVGDVDPQTGLAHALWPD